MYIRFCACNERHIAENIRGRVRAQGVDALYAQCLAAGIEDSNAHLQTKPWGSTELAILGPDENLAVFAQ